MPLKCLKNIYKKKKCSYIFVLFTRTLQCKKKKKHDQISVHLNGGCGTRPLFFLLCLFCFSLNEFWLPQREFLKTLQFNFKISATMTTVNTNKTFTTVSKALEECLMNYSQLKLPTVSRVIMQNRCGISKRTRSCIHSHKSTLSHTTRMQ